MIALTHFDSNVLSQLGALLYPYFTNQNILNLPFIVWRAASEMAPNGSYLLVFMPLCHLFPLCVLAGPSDLSLMNKKCQNWWGWNDKNIYILASLKWNLVYTTLVRLLRLTALAIHVDIMYPWYHAMERENYFCSILPIMEKSQYNHKKISKFEGHSTK